jgi:hypothetical protein
MKPAALYLLPAAVVLVRDDTSMDAYGIPVEHTRSVWPGVTTTVVHRYNIMPM